MILHDWTHQLYFSLYVKYQSYSYTRLISESIRRASPGGIWSSPKSQTLRQQLTINWRWCVLDILNPSQCIMQLNAMHMTLNPLILYICSDNILCADATVMLFRSAIPLTDCRGPCYSEFNTFDVKLSVIMLCLTVNFEL